MSELKLEEEKKKIDELLTTDPILTQLKADRVEYKREKYYKIQEELLKAPIITSSEGKDPDSFVEIRSVSISHEYRQALYLLKRIEELEARVKSLEDAMKVVLSTK